MVAIDVAAALLRFDHDVLRARERLLEGGHGDPLEDDDGDEPREASCSRG